MNSVSAFVSANNNQKKKTCPPVPCLQQHCVHLSLPWLRLQTAAVYYEQNVTDENKS